MKLPSVVLLILLAIGGTPAVLAADEPAAGTEGQAEAPPDSDIEIDEGAATVTEALQGKEGLRIQTLCTHCNSANIQVGGLDAELAPIYRNGYPVLSGLAASMIFSVLPADTVADAQVAKGPGEGVAPSYAAGGVIRLTESTPVELPIVDVGMEVGEYGLTRGRARVSGALTDWLSGTIAAGLESANRIDDDHDGNNEVGDLQRAYTEAKLEFEAGRRHDLDVGFSWVDEDNTHGRGGFDLPSYFDSMETVPAWTREDTLVDRREYRAGWQWRLGQGRTLDVRAIVDDRHQRTVSQLSASPSVPEQFRELRTRLFVTEENEFLSVRYRHPFGYWGVLSAGFEGRDQEVTALIDEQFVQQEATDVVESRGAYVDFDTKLGSQFNLIAGVRYEDLMWGAEDYVVFPGDPPDRRYRYRERTLPRATLRFRPASAWTFKLIAGATMRAPKPIFAEVCCGQRYVRNVDTNTETGTGFGFEGVFQPSPDLRVGLYAARTEFDDYLLRMVGKAEFFIPTYALANVGETRADTLEIAVRWKPVPRWTLEGSMGWLSHENTGDEQVLVIADPFDPMFDTYVPIGRIPYEPVRTGSLTATVSLPLEMQLSGGASYTGSMLIQQYDEMISFDGLLDEMRQTSGFWLANLSFVMGLPYGFEFSAGIDNLTDRLQNDLDDPTTDYNWGPLAGRSWRAALHYTWGAPG